MKTIGEKEGLSQKKETALFCSAPQKLDRKIMGILMLVPRKYKKHNLEEKLNTVELYNQGYGSTIISRELSVSISQIKQWIKIYKKLM